MVTRTTARVVLVEDELDDVILLERALVRRGFDLDLCVVDSLQGVEEALQRGAQLFLCGYHLPGFDAMDVLELVRAHDPVVPFIVVSGAIGEEKAVDLLRAGADDYVQKGRWARLVPAVHRELRRAAHEREAERLRREAAERELQLSTLLAQLPAVLWTTDCELVHTLGAGAQHSDDPCGRALQSLLENPAADVVLDAHRRALTGEAVQYRAEQSGRFLEASVRPLTDPGSGETVGVVGVALDVTDKVRMERTLAREHASLLLLQDMAEAANAASSVEELLPLALEILCEHTGWCYGHAFVRKDERRVLESSGVFFPAGARPEFEERCSRWTFDWGRGLVGKAAARREPAWCAAPGGEPSYLRHELARDAGFRACVAAPVLVGDETVAVIELFEERRMELDPRLLEDLAAIGVQLGRVFERDRALSLERQLLQTQKMEAIGRLTGEVAHDFNNMLTVIELQLALVAGADCLDEPTLDDVRLALGATERAASLTRRLLTFARRQVSEPRVTKLEAVVGGLMEMIRRLVGDRITVDCKLAEDTPPVLVDVPQIEQVVMNLVVNARDAMPEGGTLSVVVQALDIAPGSDHGRLTGAPGRCAALQVSDTGVGMSQDVAARVFEPFFSTKAEDRGTGLGLSTVHGIVAHHGGTIAVQTERGRGTRFTVVLPSAPLDDRTASDTETVTDSRPGRAHVLVVDDDPLVRRAVRRVLRQRGYQVSSAADADAGLRRAVREPPVDLVLSDVVLGGRSGVDLVRSVRREHPEVRVLLMSGFSRSELEGRVVPPPGVTILAKPFSPSVLVEAIERVLGVFDA